MCACHTCSKRWRIGRLLLADGACGGCSFLRGRLAGVTGWNSEWNGMGAKGQKGMEWRTKQGRREKWADGMGRFKELRLASGAG